MIYFSFAVNESVKVLQPIDEKIKKAGGIEMTESDIMKLKSAYGCKSCGGYLSSSTGGLLDSSLWTEKNSVCDWLLSTDRNKQIILNIQVF